MAFVFRVCAYVIAITGVVSAVASGIGLARDQTVSSIAVVAVTFGIIVLAAVMSSALAFFAYASEALADIRAGVSGSRPNN